MCARGVLEARLFGAPATRGGREADQRDTRTPRCLGGRLDETQTEGAVPIRVHRTRRSATLHPRHGHCPPARRSRSPSPSEKTGSRAAVCAARSWLSRRRTSRRNEGRRGPSGELRWHRACSTSSNTRRPDALGHRSLPGYAGARRALPCRTRSAPRTVSPPARPSPSARGGRTGVPPSSGSW